MFENGLVRALCAFVLLGGAARAGEYKDATLPVAERVRDLLGRMTLDEKVGQLEQGLFDMGMEKDLEPFLAEIRAGAIGSYILMLDDAKYRNALQKAAVTESRLGIPLLFGADVIHGHRTVFPIPLGLACAWDPELFERAQTVAAREARAMGLNWTFAPMCDLARDARWGRVAETGGEDPYLNSQFAAAAVRGFQGPGPATPGRLVACLKHFVGYSAAVGGRDYNHTEIPPFALRNMHLPPFHAGVDAGALTVMSAFNANDGIPAVANKQMLTDVLRGEWGFHGFVVSDWEGVREAIDWGFAPGERAAARLAIGAGNDVEMMTRLYRDLPRQVKEGEMPEDVLNEAVRRVLRVKFLAGLFEEPYTPEGAYAETILRPESRELAREAVGRSCVLLKNDNVLPLGDKPMRIALIGPFAADGREMLGCWISQGHGADVVTLAEALPKALPEGSMVRTVFGCDINGDVPRTKTLTDGTVVIDPAAATPTGRFDLFAAVQAASESDVVIMTLGEPWSWTGENASRASIGLTGRQQDLFHAVVSVGKPVVVVIFCGRPLGIPAVIERAAAVLVAWQPGVEAGTGISDLLTGRRDPSGRLTVSWPRESGQLPMYYNHFTTGRPAGGFIHYRDMTREPMFTFGYGLGYTFYEFGPVTVEKGDGGGLVARARVKNAGHRAGETVAQLYIRQLACQEGVRPAQELRGFQRLRLEAGEEREVEFALNGNVLGYVGRDGKWRADAGDYVAWVASRADFGEGVRFHFDP